jgi:hypothetical protein
MSGVAEAIRLAPACLSRANKRGVFGMIGKSALPRALKSEPTFPARLGTPPAKMVEFVQDFIRDDDRVSHRRIARHHLVFEAVTVPLDDQLQPIADPFITVAHNVSLAGASLVHDAPIEASFLRVSLDVVNLGATMVAKVRRSHRAGQQYFEVDCEFVSRAA